MFKTMRNRILKTNMILTSLVLIISFTVIFGFQYSNMQRQLNTMFFEAQRLSAYSLFLNNEDGFNADTSKPKVPLFRKTMSLPHSYIGFGVSEYAFYAPYFTLTLNEEGKLIEVAGDFSKTYNFYHQVYEGFKDNAYRENPFYYFSNLIKLEDKKWKYAVSIKSIFSADGKRVANVTQITFMDVTDYYKQLDRQLLTLTIIALVALGAVFLISRTVANKAIKPIEESWLRQKQFVADASHELKTPITVISANIDAIQASGDESVVSQSEWFSHIHNELAKMGKLTGDMLRLAMVEDDQKEQQPFDLSVVSESVVASTEAMLYEKGIQLKTEIEKNVLVKADKESTEQVIVILMDNASRYTNPHGSVTITLSKEHGKAVLRVSNTGDGILPEDLLKIFDRFYRPDTSRCEDIGGYGLGLAIAKAIVEKAGGTITAQSDNELTAFTVTLRLAKDMATGRKERDSSLCSE